MIKKKDRIAFIEEGKTIVLKVSSVHEEHVWCSYKIFYHKGGEVVRFARRISHDEYLSNRKKSERQAQK